MQAVLGDYLVGYYTRRPHQGRDMNGRTPHTAFVQRLPKPAGNKEDKIKAEKQPKRLAA